MNTYGKGKYLLRHAFEGDYLPHDILFREKAAFSDAVGHSMVDYLKEYAEGLYTEEEFKEKCENTPTQSRSRKNPCSTARYLKSTIPASPR